MLRVAVVLLAGVFAVASAPSEAARRSKTTAAKTAVAKKRAKQKSRAKAKRKVAARISTSKEGLPKGFSWPPNKAMKAASVACEQKLDGRGLSWERATPEGKIADPIYVPGMEIGGIKYTAWYGSQKRRIDCQLVETLAAIGPELYSIGVREVRFGSVYRNTNVRVHGMTKPQLSRHALGIAMDIKEFVDDKGRVANVELDYLKGDPLLHAIEDTVNQTHRMRIVLTPGNDPLSHYDHFHIEAAVDFTAFR